MLSYILILNKLKYPFFPVLNLIKYNLSILDIIDTVELGQILDRPILDKTNPRQDRTISRQAINRQDNF